MAGAEGVEKKKREGGRRERRERGRLRFFVSTPLSGARARR
jgi:hypothetical protein